MRKLIILLMMIATFGCTRTVTKTKYLTQKVNYVEVLSIPEGIVIQPRVVNGEFIFTKDQMITLRKWTISMNKHAVTQEELNIEHNRYLEKQNKRDVK